MESQNGPDEKPVENPGEQPVPAEEMEPPPHTQGAAPWDYHRDQESIAQPPASQTEPKTIRIEEWDLVVDWGEEEDGSIVPIYVLSGRVYGHPRNKPGQHIRHTSAILRFEGNFVWTLSGSVYKLGVPSDAFVVKRAEFDAADPLKGLTPPKS